MCGRLERCDPEILAWDFDTQAGCRRYVTRDCLRSDNGTLSSLVGRTVVYRQAQADACWALFGSMACDEEPGWDPACRGVFQGSLGTGRACAYSAECLPSHWCANISSTPPRCGTCQGRLDGGAACSSTQRCAEGFTCAAGTCRSLTSLLGRAGASCGTDAGLGCRGFALCDQAVSPSVCRTVSTLDGGSACNPASLFQVCPATQACRKPSSGAVTGVCTGRPTASQACDINTGFGLCTADTFCSAWETTSSAGTCTPRRGLSGACDDPDLRWLDGTTTVDVSYLVCAVELECNGTLCEEVPLGPGPVSCP